MNGREPESGRAPSFTTDQFRQVLAHFATGVTVVTATEEVGPVGFTCQAFASLSLDPPLVALAPSKSSTSWPLIAKAGAFCVNLLSSRQESICRAFAVSGGDKFTGLAWSPGANGAPRLVDSLAWIECDVELIHDAGDHELVIGRVSTLEAGSGEPLLFYDSAFGTFAPN